MDIVNAVDMQGLAPLAAALLFVADGPVSLEQLAQVLGIKASEMEPILAQVEAWLASGKLVLQRQGRNIQVVTSPGIASYVERFLGLDLSSRLSPAALEVLAIIAYRQPITRAEIEAIRGVNCDGVLRTLSGKGLIGEVGRLEQPGRPILYGTTFEFLQHFGLQNVEDLPPLVPLDRNS
jgi:segregation and condensation protein B